MRLIDADALLGKVQDYGEGQERLLLIDPYWVRKAPTIARPHGEWINTRPPEMSDNIVCSICGFDSIASYNFCPNCGASMSANDRQVVGKLNSEIEMSKSEIEMSKSEIVPDYRDGWRLKEGEQK